MHYPTSMPVSKYLHHLHTLGDLETTLKAELLNKNLIIFVTSMKKKRINWVYAGVKIIHKRENDLQAFFSHWYNKYSNWTDKNP